MSFEAIRQSAEQLISNWGSVPVAYDNVPFDSTEFESWARVTILDGDSSNSSLGGGCIRRTGLVAIQIFTPQHDGSSNARRLADELSGLFTNVIDAGIVYDVATLTRVGHENDFYQININVPFQIDEVLP